MGLSDRYINRELSWLDFNSRVLQEASDKSVPLIERLRFLGIFSNNLDEFFKVRYATVQRISISDKTGKKVLGGISANDLLKKITAIVIKKQKESLEILRSIENELGKENIFFINEKQVLEHQIKFLTDFFIQQVRPSLVTIILSDFIKQDFSDNRAFLVVKLKSNNNPILYSLIEIPEQIDRFIVLPKIKNKQYIMMLDDLIRFNFHLIFSMFNYDEIESHMVKITRDAELDFDEDHSKSYINKIIESVKDRLTGDPVRLVYDKKISSETLTFVKNKLGISSNDSLIPGGRYHHRRDYMNFPSLNRQDLLYSEFKPLPIDGLKINENILGAISKSDFLQYTPYHNFSYVIKFLREAALDPSVKSIKITLYRLSKDSNVISSLINAAKNGKKVIVQIEIQARFDEENNINFAELLEAAGVEIILGVPGLKVHGKICVIEKLEENKIIRYGFLSTGNFNEFTSKVYTDYTLFTSNQKILKEVNRVFSFLKINFKIKKYNHLIVSPHYTYNSLVKLIDNEIKNSNNGIEAKIFIKLNNISNYKIIDKLYEASQAGVKIKMIVRGICCLVPGIKGISENIEVISIIDKFLEHSRVFIFSNLGDAIVYLSSSDLMTRSFDNRVEVTFPVYNNKLKNQIIDTFNIGWNDNVKSRRINRINQNDFVQKSEKNYRSQWEIYEYFKKDLKKG
ncbi:MAG: polyphosphate kinase 1 [Flavobacteriaceae bacterium]|nr:polyphosphate kinase 1 [Flavobacteriaceae bacterium]